VTMLISSEISGLCAYIKFSISISSILFIEWIFDAMSVNTFASFEFEFPCTTVSISSANYFKVI